MNRRFNRRSPSSARRGAALLLRRGGGPRKVCKFCVENAEDIDYKELERLGRFVSDRGKIMPSRLTGTCAKHQRWLTIAIKRARYMALLPYVSG